MLNVIKNNALGGLHLRGAEGVDDAYQIDLGGCMADECILLVPHSSLGAGAYFLERTAATSLRFDGKDGDDELNINTALPYTPGFSGRNGVNALIVHAGSLHFDEPIDVGLVNLNVEIVDAAVEFATSQSLLTLTIREGGFVGLAGGGTNSMRVGRLSILLDQNQEPVGTLVLATMI